MGSPSNTRVVPRPAAMSGGMTNGNSRSGSSTLGPRAWLVMAANNVPGAAMAEVPRTSRAASTHGLPFTGTSNTAMVTGSSTTNTASITAQFASAFP